MRAETVAATIAEATRRWPKASFDRARLEKDLGQVCGVSEEDTTLALVDVCLARGCLYGDPGALDAFEREFVRPVRTALSRFDADETFVADGLQLVREKLLDPRNPKLAQYQGRGGLLAWVRVVASRTALNMVRDRGRHWKNELLIPESIAAVDTLDVELEAIKRQNKDVFSRALRDACAELSDRNRTVLHLYFLKGNGIDHIADVYGVHRATAARWVHAAVDDLRSNARENVKRSAKMNTVEASELERLLASQLSVSFSGLR